jgi:simple sugar transport system permease protein
MKRRSTKRLIKRAATLLLPVLASLAVGSILILVSGKNPLVVYRNLFDAGFTCHAGSGRCALLTTLQFATPLIFSGLSAVVALRAGFFSIGQAGQMLFGAAAATWVGAHPGLPPFLHPSAALLGAAFFGALWGLVPAILKEYIGVNEIISTLLLNSVAGILVGLTRPGILAESARLLPLVPGTKVTAGILLAASAVVFIYVYLWKTTHGLEMRSGAQAVRFALYGGVARHIPVLRAMALSGALAGLAGAVEVLGVHYKFVNSFSAINDFDGLIIAFAGHLHPAGVLLLSFLLGGLRAGSIVGLQIRSGIPRELGGALIALLLVFAAMHKFYRNGKEQ